MPSSVALVDAFALTHGGGSAAGQPVAIARKLCRAHGHQWDAEDESRLAAGDSERLAAVKRQIDAMNVRRSRLIEELDGYVARSVRQIEDAPLHTETLGSVIDRLSIAWVRTQKLGSTDPRGELASRQLGELAFAYDTLLMEVATGRRRVPDWRLLKSYGES